MQKTVFGAYVSPLVHSIMDGHLCLGGLRNSKAFVSWSRQIIPRAPTTYYSMGEHILPILIWHRSGTMLAVACRTWFFFRGLPWGLVDGSLRGSWPQGQWQSSSLQRRYRRYPIAICWRKRVDQYCCKQCNLPLQDSLSMRSLASEINFMMRFFLGASLFIIALWWWQLRQE
jgi:hypothetical protein